MIHLARRWPIATVSALYAALTLWITWPLPLVAHRQFASDLGDPLLVAWTMTWVMTHLTRALGGDLAALDTLWDTNIFVPERTTLAFSEHFVAQSVQMLPVWWLTHNPILAYNLAVLSTFVLTGLATFLLTRAITGGFLAPMLAGVVAAFNTYRLQLSLPSLQVLSIQWLPLALLALHRFIVSGSRGSLIAAGACLIALNLSSGYFMLYAAPIVAVFVIADLWIQGRLRDLSRWIGLAVATVCIALVTTPFVLPYLAVQRRLGFERTLDEAIALSATFEAYAIHLLPWGGIPIALAIVALVGTMVRRAGAPRAETFLVAGVLTLTFWLSLGPVVQPFGVPGPYALLWHYVPGFNGLRVVSRYGAIVLVLLAVLAGIGASVVRGVPRVGRALVIAATALFLWQIWPASIPLNGPLPSARLRNPPPEYLTPSTRLPEIYEAVLGLDPSAVIAELPFGDPWYDLRYMFFAATHQRRLMNGYSGFFPRSYIARQRVLADPLARPAAAIDALAGATHIIVHEQAWPEPETGPKVIAWLDSVGAQVVATGDGATLLALSPVRRNARLNVSRP
jgi:hypothetical protein